MKKQVGSSVTLFVYADEGLVGEYEGAGMMRKLYGWKPDGLWGTDPLYMVEGGNYYFYHNDHLGTPQRLTSAADGAVVWGAGYLAFGAVVVDPSSAVENNLRFPGQYADAETGLYYNFQRYYDPVRGRYTQVDPIGFAGGDVNLYGYVKNNSNNYLDPLGLFFWYGYYGGPDLTAGLEMSWDQLPQGTVLPEPIDSQDWQYFKHDQNYGICRSSLPKDSQWKGFARADGKLLGDLMKLPLSPSNWDEPPIFDVTSNIQRFMAISVFTLKITVNSAWNAVPEVYRNFKKTLSGEPIY
ncbi:RHS repeat domain-containing protein [Desulfuromonas soudanensis]|uniref:RHS repeat domain-containing protein n=1 Tax=Desulfuromonas soudanensis TaxID=1603606 RepID=UPI001E28B702|nr:RHS repeat-associated core domain-containing protein [Desulfuromonas soudanensis]